jgi:hypothetical protein
VDRLPVALGLMTAGELRYETHESIIAAHLDGVISRHYVIQNGPYLDNGRNQLVRIFQSPKVRDACTHLLMVDSDIAFDPQDIRDLYAAAQERAVVGAVYYSNFPGKGVCPIVYDWTTNELGLKTLEVIEAWDDGWPLYPVGHAGSGPDPIVRVEAIGAGFLMMRYEVVDVLEAVFGEPQPWFDEPVIDGMHFGEDLAFCIRAKNSGFGVWAHRGVEVAHIKPTIIGPQPGYKMAAP